MAISIPALPHGVHLDDTDVGPFRELRYETADRFLHDLSPHGRLFGPDAPLGNGRWLFRGVKDSTFRRVPSAFHDRGAAQLFLTPPELWSQFIGVNLPAMPMRRCNQDHPHRPPRPA